MRAYLFRDHTALLENDGSEVITTIPAAAGTLEIEGRSFAVDLTGTVLRPQTDLIGRVRVTFTTDSGIRYVGERPHMDNGIPVSALDYRAEYAKMRIRMDELERQVETLADAYHKLYNETRHDALGFLTHNTKKMEVQ